MENFSCWNYMRLLILRPVVAVSFVILFIMIGWLLAWKMVLKQVPLVQEIFGLRKKAATTKPKMGRVSKYYNNLKGSSSTSASLNFH